MLDHCNSKEERYKQSYCQSLHSSPLKDGKHDQRQKVRRMGGKGKEGGKEGKGKGEREGPD